MWLPAGQRSAARPPLGEPPQRAPPGPLDVWPQRRPGGAILPRAHAPQPAAGSGHTMLVPPS
eukprot:9734603-Alexandrium_andersonii.AAC.1